MDSLALLCNLYGDGPATLRRLRVQGVLRIEDLARRDGDELTAMLALPPATARRFLKEAATLKERVLEHEATPSRPAAAVAPIETPAPVAAAVSPAERGEERTILRGKESMLDAAAQRWRELERSGTPPSTPAVVASEPPAPATPLNVEDLDAATRRAFAEAGITSLEQLLARDSEELAQACGMGSSQVLFAQGLARRRLRDLSQRKVVATPAPGPGAAAAVSALSVRPSEEREVLGVRVLSPTPPPKAKFSPSERPPSEWLPAPARGEQGPERQSAGPFA